MISPGKIPVIEGESIASTEAKRPSVHVTPEQPLIRGDGDDLTDTHYVSVVGHPSRRRVVDPVFRTRVLPGSLGSAATDMVVGAKTGAMRLIVALQSKTARRDILVLHGGDRPSDTDPRVVVTPPHTWDMGGASSYNHQIKDVVGKLGSETVAMRSLTNRTSLIGAQVMKGIEAWKVWRVQGAVARAYDSNQREE